MTSRCKTRPRRWSRSSCRRRPARSIVDACAGAGGKTLGLAGLLGGRGRVIALDVVETKLDELRRRARRAGASNVRAIGVDLLAPGETLRPFEGTAARVLVDAPCTGLGAIRRNPEVRWRLLPAQIVSLGEAQGRAPARLGVARRAEGPPHLRHVLVPEARGRGGVRELPRWRPPLRPRDGARCPRALAHRGHRDARRPLPPHVALRRRERARADGGAAGMDGFFGAVARLVGDRPERASDLPGRASVLPGDGEPPERP